MVKVIARSKAGKINRSIVVDRRPVNGKHSRMTVRKAKKSLWTYAATVKVERVAA